MTEKHYREYGYLTSTIIVLEDIKDLLKVANLSQSVKHNANFGNKYFPQIENNTKQIMDQEIERFKKLRDEL